MRITTSVYLQIPRLKPLKHYLQINFAIHLSTPIFAVPKREISSAGSEHLPYKQGVTGSNPVSPTKQVLDTSKAFFYENSARSLPESALSRPVIPFTNPILNTGKEPSHIPRGSNKYAEIAKNKWNIEFQFYDDNAEKMVRIRLTKQLNRIKEYKDKLEAFLELQASCTTALRSGWNPIDARSNAEQVKKVNSIYLEDAKSLFIEYHQGKGTRVTTLRSYISKIQMFIEHLGNRRVDKITDYDITDFLNTYERKRQWSGVTYNYAKISLNNLFKFLIVNKYVSANPVTQLERRKVVRTEKHQVFSDDDFVAIMQWLRAYDPYCLLFIQSIYYTCIRPRELRYTQLKFIDLNKNRITIPAHISKNKKSIPVKIDPAFREELLKLNIEHYPQDYFLFGDTTNIIGRNRIGENTPYNRFQKCLIELNLTNKNYTLYSFKHLSNVRKYLAGWTIAEICAANRHSSLVETETYLKDLIKFIPVTKPIPVI